MNFSGIGINYIFVHNLGSFDGYFIFKAISQLYRPSQIKTMIDHHNRFIKISLKLEEHNKEFVWLYSYRIFHVSLQDLCKQFNVEGKLNDYNPD